MGIKDTISAANRYAENSDLLDKIGEGKIGWDTPEHKQQWNYFVTSGDSGNDIHTIYELAAKSLKANGKEINEENLRHFFDSLIQAYAPQGQSTSSPEQIQDLEKEMGTESKGNGPAETSDWGGEQIADLKNLLGGMKEGPDNRFKDDDYSDVGPLW